MKKDKRRAATFRVAVAVSSYLPLLALAQPPTGPQIRPLREMGQVPGGGDTASAAHSDAIIIRFARQLAGDCVMDDTKVTLFRDGSVKFEAVVSSHRLSSMQTDHWHVRIELIDDDRTILNSQSWDSPRINAADRKLRWRASGHFDPHLYASIAGATIDNQC